jgi:hypothetical protein
MKTILGILILVFAFGANAASDVDPNEAMIAIRLEGDKKTEFSVMMRRLNRDINDSIRKERMRNAGTMSARELEKRMKRSIKRHYKKLDDPANDILREDQWDAYLAYKEAHHADTLKQDFNPPQSREL